MDIFEARKKQNVLEQDIRNLIRGFERDTELFVEAVSIQAVTMLSDSSDKPISREIKVKTEVKI